ncbi:hypothetical protein BT93_E2290 [Corymbia citriodora subsp. variegata]|nr:hypothetical protein BT93_E2290 [Corymbia citriodora subsp. variegata]
MATQPSEEQGNSSHAEPATETSEEEVNELYYRSLVRAAFKGDWEFATRFFKRDSTSKTAKITNRLETLLHVAALSAQAQFFENLVDLLTLDREALDMVDRHGRTALHNAVLCGSMRTVKALVSRDRKLTQLADNEGRVPLDISALEAPMHKEIAWFLVENTKDNGPSHYFSSPSAIDTILDLIYGDHPDLTLNLVGRYSNLLTERSTKYPGQTLLHALASMESYWPSGTKLSVLEALIYKFPIIKRVHEVKVRHTAAIKLAKQVCIAISDMNIIKITHFFNMEELPFQATSNGINEFVKCCIQFFPELIWISPFRKRLITHAVNFRQERTFGLFLKVSSTNKLSLLTMPTWQESFEMMFAVTQYTPTVNRLTNVAGAAFKMQRELQWYKVVEELVIPSARTYRLENRSCWQIFVENHKELLKNREKWVKDTSNSCMLVSTLIAIVLFAAAFTVPGAILLFLAILTSQFEAQDFLHSLPKKIIMGLSLLFLSLAFMLVAFAATLTIVLDKRLGWVLIPITLLASLPLLYQMVKSTYGHSIFRPEGIWDGVDYTEQDQ